MLAAVLAAFCLTVCLSTAFWWSGREYARVTFDEEYYFLVRDCESATAAAVAGQAYFSGGAGYLIEDDTAVVLACYYKESSANQVRENLETKGVETRILTLVPADLVLSGEIAAYKARIGANAETADSCARLLYDTANGLERTELSQEEARAALRGIVKSLKGLCMENGEAHFEQWNNLLRASARRGTEIAEGIIFAKDIRYMQVELCLAVVDIGNYFG